MKQVWAENDWIRTEWRRCKSKNLKENPLKKDRAVYERYMEGGGRAKARKYSKSKRKKAKQIVKGAHLETEGGMCECKGTLDSGRVCNGCDRGNGARAVKRCTTIAQVFDHVTDRQRSMCKAAGHWPTTRCGEDGGCGGACATVNEVNRPWLPPSELAQYVPLQGGDTLSRHWRCVAQSICVECHSAWTTDRSGPETPP